MMVDENGEHVAFVLFLEPAQRAPPNESTGEAVLNFLITACQPSPTMMHTEILLLPNDRNEHRCSFATYIDAQNGAAWQPANNSTLSYYLLENAGRWRAVPVYGKDLTAKLRAACSEEVGTKYSMLRYVTSTRLFRPLNRLLSSHTHAPAHCAVLTARCLRRAGYDLRHCSNYYSPSTLFLELDHHLPTSDTSNSYMSSTKHALLDHQAASALTRAAISRDTVAYLGDARCKHGISALAQHSTTGSAQQRRVQQRALATGLLRSVLLR